MNFTDIFFLMSMTMGKRNQYEPIPIMCELEDVEDDNSDDDRDDDIDASNSMVVTVYELIHKFCESNALPLCEYMTVRDIEKYIYERIPQN